MKYYVFNLPLEAAQIRKMKEAWDECIGPGQPGSGLFCTVIQKRNDPRNDHAAGCTGENHADDQRRTCRG